MKEFFELIDRSGISCFTWAAIIVVTVFCSILIYLWIEDRKIEIKKEHNKRRYSLKVYMNM
jgi:hypothetical protein